ncbi:MAG: LuxR C-terminal-related transcriptional regulator [Defluviitaleaceae bacterium]|nr:LuxR C-terminal-related transcriptional regulator [Defluviitaleaceae bacterium]
MKTPASKPAVPRNELMKRITSLAEKKKVYIHAPAGYGKSFSVSMWAKNSGNPYVRFALNTELNEKPALFYEGFAGSLLKLQQDNNDLREITKHHAFSSAPVEFTLRALEAFASDDNTYILILDDLHLITHDEILKRLNLFIKQMPENITPLFLSRTAPPDNFAEFIVKDSLAIIEANALLFDIDEIKSLFAAYGHSLTQNKANEILSSTGGWAIAINAVLLSGAGLSVKKIAERHWETFIQNEVWDRWDDRIKMFMIKCSIMDKLTPELCDALTGEKNSGRLLDRLVSESVFLSVYDENTYYFHHLFQQFLKNMLDKESEKLSKDLYRKAGDYFYKQKDYYKAVRYYLGSGDSGGISKGLKKMYDYNSPYASIEDTLAIIKLSVDGSIVDKYPFLLEVQAWAAFVEGRHKDMEEYLDRYFKLIPKILLQNPSSVQVMFLLRCMNFKNSLIDVTKSVGYLPIKYLAKGGTPSITQNLPFFHRSVRDFTEYLVDMDKNLKVFAKTFGSLISDEYETCEDSIRAGLFYEQGDMVKALFHAIEANVKMRDEFAAEIKFCAMMILAEVYRVLGQTEDMQKSLDNVHSMIERDRAYYLGANLQAYICRCKLENGDEDAAKKWLREYAVGIYDELSLFKLYQHFTTTRAHITLGDYSTAIIFTKKLLALCEAYQRPIDIIESRVLLSIACWKKGRGNQNEALDLITEAIACAEKYAYTQVFSNEGAELINMLQRLSKVASQKDYNGELSGAFVKTLYFAVLARSKSEKGLTGGRVIRTLKFTEAQSTVMRLLCEGHSRNEIAEKMGITPYGVKSHLGLVYKKLDVPGGIEAVIKIKELGLLNKNV